MFIYVISFILGLAGLLMLLGFREEDKYIQELLESARKATQESYGSE